MRPPWPMAAKGLAGRNVPLCQPEPRLAQLLPSRGYGAGSNQDYFRLIFSLFRAQICRTRSSITGRLRPPSSLVSVKTPVPTFTTMRRYARRRESPGRFTLAGAVGCVGHNRFLRKNQGRQFRKPENGPVTSPEDRPYLDGSTLTRPIIARLSCLSFSKCDADTAPVR